MSLFEPTLEAAQARLATVDPDAYARTRNALDGAVTRLSPYLTHGLLSLREVYESVNARHPLDNKHKFVFELGWRAYWHHVWAHLGNNIHQSIHAGLLPDDAYQPEMPADVLEARTGIPAIDLAVVCAVLSSNADIPVPMDVCFAGEVGLTGEIRPVTRTEQRIAEAAKLGFARIFVPTGTKGVPTVKGMEVVQVARVEEVLAHLFA